MRPSVIALTLALGGMCLISGCGHDAAQKTQPADPGAEQLGWLLQSVSGSTLVIEVEDYPGCDDGPHGHLTQSDQQVSVLYTTHSTLPPGESCALGGPPQPPQTVHLKKPLGSRSLVGCRRGRVNCRTITLEEYRPPTASPTDDHSAP